MENLFNGLSLALVVGAIATYISIVRDVLPHLAPEHREPLKHYFDNSGYWQLRAADKAIRKAWQAHGERFPNSHKKQLFAALLIVAALSVMAYPLWLMVR